MCVTQSRQEHNTFLTLAGGLYTADEMLPVDRHMHTAGKKSLFKNDKYAGIGKESAGAGKESSETGKKKDGNRQESCGNWRIISCRHTYWKQNSCDWQDLDCIYKN